MCTCTCTRWHAGTNARELGVLEQQTAIDQIPIQHVSTRITFYTRQYSLCFPQTLLSWQEISAPGTIARSPRSFPSQSLHHNTNSALGRDLSRPPVDQNRPFSCGEETRTIWWTTRSRLCVALEADSRLKSWSTTWLCILVPLKLRYKGKTEQRI